MVQFNWKDNTPAFLVVGTTDMNRAYAEAFGLVEADVFAFYPTEDILITGVYRWNTSYWVFVKDLAR